MVEIGSVEWLAQVRAEGKRSEAEYKRIEARNNRWFLGVDCDEPISTESLLADEYPNLTPKQRDVLAATLNEAVDETMRTKGWLRRNLDKLTERDPAMIEPVPSPQELFSALGYDGLPARERIEKFRALEQLGEDERLAMMPARVKKTEPERKSEVEQPATPATELTDDQVDDLISERLGFTSRFAMRAGTSATKLRHYRAAVRKDLPKLMPGNAQSLGTATSADIDVTSEAFKKLPAQTRLTRFRAAVGK